MKRRKHREQSWTQLVDARRKFPIRVDTPTVRLICVCCKHAFIVRGKHFALYEPGCRECGCAFCDVDKERYATAGSRNGDSL